MISSHKMKAILILAAFRGLIIVTLKNQCYYYLYSTVEQTHMPPEHTKLVRLPLLEYFKHI